MNDERYVPSDFLASGRLSSAIRGLGVDLIGHSIGPYHITALLGVGGMGEVYRARDIKLGRDVAIKILPRLFTSDPDRLGRFDREARMLASLNHPHIGAIYGLEEADGTRALVLELVEGETLADRIARGRIPLKDAMPIARQIADALDAAHERGIVHRDLKPANIKITPDGTVKVLDFGLAKAIVHDSATSDPQPSPTLTIGGTREGSILGTAAYMSPEQARGLPVDKRTDIWAFGCVVYEMLTRRNAFVGQTVSDTIAAILDREPDFTVLPPTTPPAITRLLRRCLEKDVRRRVRDIGDARMVLDDFPFREPAVVPAVGSWRVLTLVAIAALGIGAAMTAILFNERAATSLPAGVPGRMLATQLTNYGGTESGGALSPDGRSFVFVSDHAGMPDIYLRQVSGGELVRLTNDAAEEADPAFAPDGDGIYFTRTDRDGTGIWRTGVFGGTPQKVLDNAQTAAPSPDGKSLAYLTRGDPGFALVVKTIEGGAARMLVKSVRTGTLRPAWSPDGRWLTYSNWALFGPVDVFVVDTQTGQQRRVTQLPQSTAANDGGKPVWLPDNRHLVISYPPSARLAQAAADLGILDIQDGSIRRLTTMVGDGLFMPSVSADGSRLIATKMHQLREIWRVPLRFDADANGRAATRLIDESAGAMWTFISRDGRTALFNSPATGSRNLWTMQLDGPAAPRQITSVPGDAISHSSLSPDGARVAFASVASGHSDIWTQRVDGSDLRQLTNDEPADSWPVWSPDGEWIVYQTYVGGRSETWRVRASGGPPEQLLDRGFRGDLIRQPGGNGTWLVTTGSRTGSGVTLIDVERRVVVWEQPIQGGSLSLPVFSADGTSINAPFREDRDHDVVRIFDSATGASRIAIRLPFHVMFRADWTDEGRAVIVNRADEVSHIVMFDNFWTKE